jgi:hypothetical protein
MYEVLEYESTLELQDKHGERVTFRKRERVRYLQNNLMAFQDQAWGDGEILHNYRCNPGTAVDFHRPGHKTYILISLREIKKRGDIDDFNIEWGIRDGFHRKLELWETEIRSEPGLSLTTAVTAINTVALSVVSVPLFNWASQAVLMMI